MTRAQFQRHLFPGINKVIYLGYNEFPEEYSQIFSVEGSDAAFEEDLTVAGLGLFVKTPENVEVAQDGPAPGFAKRYQHDDYTLAVGASHQMRRDSKTAIWRERARDLGISARQTKEILHADVFAQGFTVANGSDGEPLFSAVHPNEKGIGTQNNILAPVATVSVLSVRLALTQFRRFFDATGVRRVKLMPRWLVHPPEEEYNVLEILRSAGRPDTANRADNVVRNALMPFTWDYLPDVNDWFVISDKAQHKLRSFNREQLSNRDWLDEMTSIQWVISRMAFSFGFSHWIGTLGSNPV